MEGDCNSICGESKCVKAVGHIGHHVSSGGVGWFEGETAPLTDVVTFPTGAKRSKVMPRYDLIPAGPLRRIAGRFELGIPSYGEFNYKKGLPFDDTLNHIIEHLQAYKERRKEYLRLKDVDAGAVKDMTLADWMKQTETDGDDLAAAAWGCIAIMYLEEEGRLM